MKVIVAGRLSRKVKDRDQTGLDSQERESVRWAEAQGHEVVEVVPDIKSGRSGLEARPNLRPWVTEPELLARYDAIVALKVDRLTRGDRAETAKLEQWAREHGKKLMIAGAGVQFPSEGTEGIQWDLMLRIAHQEWLAISERYTRMQRTRREAGSVVGRPPWGFAIVCAGCGEAVPKGKSCCAGRKVLVPTAEGRRYVPTIYRMAVDGKSLREIAAWLDAEGVAPMSGTRWNEGVIGKRLLANPAYHGQRRGALAGAQPVTEALVSLAVWQEAQAVVSARARRGRGTVKHEPPLARPVCRACLWQPREGCPSGVSPMYVVRVQYRDGSIRRFYRCTGHGPQRKGCGVPMIPVEAMETAITEAMASDTRWHRDRVFVAGDDLSDRIARLHEQVSAAMRNSDYAGAQDAMTEAQRLESAERVAPHWDEVRTTFTEGAHYAALDRDGRREYLARHLVTARLKDDGTAGVTIADPARGGPTLTAGGMQRTLSEMAETFLRERAERP